MSQKTALLIVPTYNEAKNIGKLLDTVFSLKAPAMMGWRLDVLVLDDTSPDGTGEIVKQLAATKYQGRLFLTSGKKEGLGRALQKAFDAALNHPHQVILTMDADFSHDPHDIQALLTAIDEGADVAIGSRYIEGGLIPGNWPLGLIIRTRIATQVARWLGGVSKEIRELTTNFRAMRRHVLESIKYNDIKANGYGIQIFLANAFTSRDFTVTEVPITFRSRAHGASKARLKDVLEFFRIAYNLNSDSPAKQIIRFMLVGASGVLINLASLWLFKQLIDTPGAPNPLASFVAIQVSIIWNFCWHSLFTFRSFKQAAGVAKNVGLLISNFARYECAMALSQLIVVGVYTVLSLADMHYLVAQFSGIVVAFIVNYYLSSTYIWSAGRAHAR